MDFFAEPVQVTGEMRGALAKMYADEHMRAYLVNAIRVANENSLTLLETGDVDAARAYVSRSKSLKQLLEKGKEHFTNLEKLTKLKL
jgi:ABC-type molybdate transport system substrate-binding protein